MGLESHFRHPKNYSYADCSFIIPGSLVRLQAGLFCGHAGANSGCVGRVRPARRFQICRLTTIQGANASFRARATQKDQLEFGNSPRLRARVAGCAMG